jgi:transcriptional regulator with XRE-family HTH domain
MVKKKIALCVNVRICRREKEETMSEDVKILINKLYADMAMHKIRAYQLAQRAEIGANVLSNWRTGKQSPTLAMYVHVRRVLDGMIDEA